MTKPRATGHRLLSIQSHVVHGYVGNRAATFPLQLRGWDVDSFNTVQFSNHPAYGHFTGHRLSADVLREIAQGLTELHADYDAVLTGYVPSDEALAVVFDICAQLVHRGIKWVLDPVLGDNGRLYVSEGNVALYKQILKSGLVSLVTPNQLELEVLTGVQVTDLDSLKRAIDTFNMMYSIDNLIVTSVVLQGDAQHLYSAGSSRVSSSLYRSFYFKVPSIPAAFSGSGDLFSALLTCTTSKYDQQYGSLVDESTAIDDLPLAHALNEVISIVEKVLQVTYDYEAQQYRERGESMPTTFKINDLKLIQAREYFLQDLANHQVFHF